MGQDTSKEPKAESLKTELNKQNNDGDTPIFLYVKRNKLPTDKIEAFVELLKYGADCTMSDKCGNNLLHACCQYGRTEEMNILFQLALGTDVKSLILPNSNNPN